MRQIIFSFKDSLISDSELANVEKKIQEEIDHMDKAVTLGYKDDRASMNLPFDKDALRTVKALVNEKIKLNPRFIVVVGIGGSNLGTMAVQEAVLGKLYNQLDPKIRIYYAETVDSDAMNNVVSILESALKKGENVIINGVSKSGTTTETVANFEILVNLLKKYKENHEQYVVVTTDKDSKLWNFGKDKGFAVLEIPKKVGGRYSVFSPVGLFPLGLIGVDIDSLLEGAVQMRDICLSKNIMENPAALSAALICLQYHKGKNIHNLFLFGSDLESVGKWYRQLMGESLGKEYNRKGEQVFEGITPTFSIGSTDLHSVAQLYLGGPFDKFTTFVTVENSRSKIDIPNLPEYSQLVDNIQGKPLSEIMDAIEKGVKIAYRKRKRPFIEVILPDKSESSIGQLLQFKMMEMMYLGALLEVNPFDQPNVESYKSETRKILANNNE